ncbi:hypothetical protein [Aureibaculum conchae]|uniref:hypothetical protein n=1 Tax=Aureibaculum sp. 2308TA14-22 TaxID=3108392 RepID=UPI003398F3B8
MKNKSSQLLVVGLLLVLLGAVLKIFKMEIYSNTILIVGLVLEILAGVLFFYNRVTPKRR